MTGRGSFEARAYGRAILVAAAFGLIAAIVAAPLVERLWPSRIAVTESRDEADSPHPTPLGPSKEANKG